MASNNANKEFARTYQHYLEEIAQIDLSTVTTALGLEYNGHQIKIRFLQRDYRISPEGIINEEGDRAGLDTCVILSKYILMCPDELPAQGPWTAYRDFKDTGPLTVYFRNEIEMGLIRKFAANVTTLEKTAERLGGYPPDTDAAYSFKVQFDALPHIPILVLFNDADEEFAADCSVLFRASAEKYLDGESLAILAHRLVTILGKG